MAAALLAIAAIVGLVSVRSTPVERTSDAKQAAPLEFLAADLYTLEHAAFARTLPLTGTLAPLVEATVKAKVPGELIEVAVREGEAVQRGQTLARIDKTEVHARVAARAADLEVARAQLALAQKNQATQKALLDQHFISQNAFDATQSNLEVAAAKVRAAAADLELAHKSLGDAVLVAPFAGIVARRHAEPGERVAVDAPVLSIVNLARLELEAAVPAQDIAQVKVGQKVVFRVAGFGAREFDGRVERINPAAAAGSRSISIYALIDNPDGALRGGMFVQGMLTLEELAEALAIPASAVREEDGGRYVYAIEDGIVRRKPVALGVVDRTGHVNVISGLAAGAVIVRDNFGQLREGATVRVIEKATAER